VAKTYRTLWKRCLFLNCEVFLLPLQKDFAVGHAARDARNARRASRIRMRASSPRIARVITAPFPDVNHARARRSLARSSAAAYVATPHVRA
jgi:hypothetical protein